MRFGLLIVITNCLHDYAPFIIYRIDFQHIAYYSVQYNNLTYGHGNDKVESINRQKH